MDGPSREGVGDAPSQKHANEKLLEGCDPVLMEVYELAMLQSQDYLCTGTTPQRELLGLCWGLLALLSKGDGMVSAHDIASLLLHKNLESNALETCRAFDNFEKENANLTSLLIAGKTKEAIELAMRQGAWHRALILNNLEKYGPSDCFMLRFIKNLDDLDVMKTYYQVRLGEMPEYASQCVVDDRGNWRLHLAIVIGISNSSCLRKEIISKMAETLASKGHMHAAHFCQMVLQLDLEQLPKTSLQGCLVGEWMELLAKMHKDITQPPLVALLPKDPEERKVPLSENHLKELFGPLLPPAVHDVPKDDKALVDVTQSPLVEAGKNLVDHEKENVPLSKESKLLSPIPQLSENESKEDKALVEETRPKVKAVEKKALKKKQSKKMSWLSCFSCFGSRTMD